MQHLRRLNAQQVRDIARGAAVLGTGGGGDPYLGTLSALQALEEYGSPEIIEAHEVPDDGMVALPVLVGAPVAFLEEFPSAASSSMRTARSTAICRAGSSR